MPLPAMSLIVTPEEGLADQPVDIRLEGLGPRERVDLHAHMRDDRHRLWESHAAFVADENGRVSLHDHAPVAGTYSGMDSMGLFWSMALDTARNGYATAFVKKEFSPATIKLGAWTERGARVSGRIVRHYFAPGTEIRDVRDEGLVGKLFIPPGADRLPALILLGGSGGGLDWEKAALLSSHGYVTLALAYFGIPPLPRTLRNLPLEYFATAIRWLSCLPQVDGNRLAVMGSSKGGELALLLAATFPEIRAVIGIVPTGVLWQGFGKGPAASWTHGGRPLPYAPVPSGRFQAESFFRLLFLVR